VDDRVAAEILGYKLVPIKLHHPRTGTTAEKWAYERRPGARG